MADAGGDTLGDGPPDLVGSLVDWFGVDSFEGTLDTGKEHGSKAKLLILLC